MPVPPGRRPAPYPGPRCATHNYQEKRRRKAAQIDRNTAMRFGAEAVEWYPRMKAYQDGLCAICRRAKGISKRLAIDHDHKLEGTDEDAKRGLLCGPCNSMLAHSHDSPEMFERAADYLRYPPAKAMEEGIQWF